MLLVLLDHCCMVYTLKSVCVEQHYLCFIVPFHVFFKCQVNLLTDLIFTHQMYREAVICPIKNELSKSFVAVVKHQMLSSELAYV